MPPKDGKKQASGKSSATANAKEGQKVSIEDLLFPRTVIASLAKESAQHGQDRDTVAKGEELRKVMLSKDAVTALQRSATVFVNHLLVYARDSAGAQGRRSCSVDDVLLALNQCGMEGLEGLVRAKLDVYLQMLELRKREKSAPRSSAKLTNASSENATGERDEDEEEDGDEDQEDEQEKELGGDTNGEQGASGAEPSKKQKLQQPYDTAV
ncbi:LAQU0S25e00716g1_1 [Lachancea quebecensis]|uniref:DNA polymerase epsilon subunit D n=1 Tax=Lachancea quebecensis TaxID=1654605 RepID=A0A0P1KY99_9SACH|nr:LAQU0S25e00716g1_1 [Lachancea quebecensis]